MLRRRIAAGLRWAADRIYRDDLARALDLYGQHAELAAGLRREVDESLADHLLRIGQITPTQHDRMMGRETPLPRATTFARRLRTLK